MCVCVCVCVCITCAQCAVVAGDAVALLTGAVGGVQKLNAAGRSHMGGDGGRRMRR